MSAFYAYSFQDVIAAIVGPGGAFPIAGSETGSADEGIKIAYADDKGSIQSGADGSWMHNLHAANVGTLELTLLKNSPINQLLNVMYDLQRSSGSNWGQNTIIVTQLAAGDSYTNEGAAFAKFPENGYGKDGATMTWKFNVGRIDPKLGSGI